MIWFWLLLPVTIGFLINYTRHHKTQVTSKSFLISRVTGILSYIEYFCDKEDEYECVKEEGYFSCFQFEKLPRREKRLWMITLFSNDFSSCRLTISPINEKQVEVTFQNMMILRPERSTRDAADYEEMMNRAKKMYARAMQMAKPHIEKASK